MPEKTTTHFNTSRGEEIRIACSECNNMTRHTVVASVDITDVDEVVMLSWTKHQVVKCLGCETYGFRRHYKDTEDFYVEGGEMILLEAEEIYPPRLVGRKKLRDTRDLPYKVRRISETRPTRLSSRRCRSWRPSASGASSRRCAKKRRLQERTSRRRSRTLLPSGCSPARGPRSSRSSGSSGTSLPTR